MLSLLLVLASLLLSPQFTHADGVRELYRIRIVNREFGSVEVSADSGQSYLRVGKVLLPATKSVEGFEASKYGESGAVVATAVHGIRIKTSGERNCVRGNSKIFSIVPCEFEETPKGFGGHIAGSSGIYTDIPTGEAIFRNLAPFVNSPVFLELADGLHPLPFGYIPRVGDVLVIVIQVPARYPKEITFENKVDGQVEMVYDDGKEIIAKVERPVKGIGRFDATGYTGIGRINTNHSGVLTISTAPIVNGGKDGSSKETRGGFMIQPSRHSKTISHHAQVMVVAPSSPDKPWLEGAAPIFGGYIGLASDNSNPTNSFMVDIKTTNSDWTALPSLIGKDDSALMHLPGGKGAVTDIRLRFPEFSPNWIRGELNRCNRAYLDAAKAEAIKKGSLLGSEPITIKFNNIASHKVTVVNFYIDGEFRGVSNNPPYEFTLNSRNLSAGEHAAQLEAKDAHGAKVGTMTRVFFVEN